MRTGKFYVNDQSAVLDVISINPHVKVFSGVPHITVALVPGVRPADSKNAISGESAAHIISMKLQGVLVLAAAKEPKPEVQQAPKELDALAIKKKEINKKIFQLNLDMQIKKELGAIVQKSESIEHVKNILSQKLSPKQLEQIFG